MSEKAATVSTRSVTEGDTKKEDAIIIQITVPNFKRPTIQKEITNGKDSEKSFDKDETIKYQVTLSIPENIDEYTKFEYEDIPGTGLTIDTSTLKITVPDNGSTKQLTANTDYILTEVTANGDKAKGYKLNFIMNNNKVTEAVVNAVGSKMTITYDAKITAEGEQKIDNDVNLTYTHTGKERYDTAKQTVKTYGKRFVKKDGGRSGVVASGDGLENAEFLVARKKDKNAKDFKNIEYLVEKETNGQKSYSWASDTKGAKVLKSGKDGAFEITGLKKGTYYLKEIKAPDKFRLPVGDKAFTEFKVDEKSYNVEKPLRSNFDFGDTTITEPAEPDVILNRRTPELPLTGKENLILYGGTGSLLLLIALVVLKKKERKAA